jgi:hypothetical protein
MSFVSSSCRVLSFVASWRCTTRSLWLTCLLGLLATNACTPVTGACTDDLSWRLTPRERTLRVGESFTPELALFGCRGSRRLSDVVTWATENGDVVAVDAATGRVAALAAGQATVTASAAHYGVRDAVHVTVTAP